MTTGKGEVDELIQRAKAGERAVLDALFSKLGARLKQFIQWRMRSYPRESLSADEILQDTFVRAFKSIGRFRGDDEIAFRRWITGIANKAVSQAAEDARRKKTLQIQGDAAAADVSPSKSVRRQERFERFQASFDDLSEDYRTVLFLTRIEGLSLKQAGERMGRSEDAVKMLFFRAMKKLRQRMRNSLTDTESLNLPDRRLKRRGAEDGE